MKTLALRGGDLDLVGGQYAMTDGPQKIVQDLRCAFLEPLGNDRFHPGYGSQLDDAVGLLLDPALLFSIEQEVARVVSNYVAIQRDQVERDALRGVRSRFKTSDLIGSVDEIDVRQQNDRVQVTIRLTTAANVPVSVSMTAGE